MPSSTQIFVIRFAGIIYVLVGLKKDKYPILLFKVDDVKIRVNTFTSNQRWRMDSDYILTGISKADMMAKVIEEAKKNSNKKKNKSFYLYTFVIDNFDTNRHEKEPGFF